MLPMGRGDDENEGMDTSGELRRREQAEEAARQERATEQERERLRILEAAREAERRRRDD
jgi:hypothetical protein